MLLFTNSVFGKTITFKVYYNLDGQGKKVTYSNVNGIGVITDYREEITESGIKYGYIVKNSFTGENCFVLESDCDLYGG
jgi:hypothetical protein